MLPNEGAFNKQKEFVFDKRTIAFPMPKGEFSSDSEDFDDRPATGKPRKVKQKRERRLDSHASKYLYSGAENCI